MYRTLSGFSLAEGPPVPGGLQARRGSEQVGAWAGVLSCPPPQVTPVTGGKRSFRSKRFSRNLDPRGLEASPGQGMRRAQSFHMDQREDGESWLDTQRRYRPCPCWPLHPPPRSFQRATSKSSLASERFGGARLSDSDSGEVGGHRVPDRQLSWQEGPHFTSTVTSHTRGPGAVGSYLARQEFGSSEVGRVLLLLPARLSYTLNSNYRLPEGLSVLSLAPNFNPGLKIHNFFF